MRETSLVDATPARKHIKSRLDQGMPLTVIAERASITVRKLNYLMTDGPSAQPRLQKHRADAILAVTFDPATVLLVPGGPVRERMRWLLAHCYPSVGAIAAQTPYSPRMLGDVLDGA